MAIAKDNDTEVLSFLESYGRALGEGKLERVSAAWEVPALVLSDQGAIHVESAAQIEHFFGEARQDYNRRGIVATKPDILKADKLSEAMVQVRVRWTLLDEKEKPKGEELSVYVLRRDGDRRLRIRVAIMLGG